MNASQYEKEIAALKADLEATEAELERLKRQLRKEADEKLAAQARLIDKLAKSRFALKINCTSILWEIINWNGDYQVTRRYHGLQTGEGLHLHFIRHRAFSSTPNSKFADVRLISEQSSPGVTMDFSDESESVRVFQINYQTI